jgi:hypothetical protein
MNAKWNASFVARIGRLKASLFLIPLLVAASPPAARVLRPSQDHAATRDRETRTGNAGVLRGSGAAPDGFSVTAGAARADSEWSEGIASRIAREEYRASRTAHGLQAPNRAHNLRTHFRAGGIDVSPRDHEEAGAAWQLTWRTTRWGRSGQLTEIESADIEPRLDGDRVTYVRRGIDEWYENRREGLEQGFTVHERPRGSGSLVVAGHLGGKVRPQLSREDGAIDLLDERAGRVLRYGGLHVWDADGTELPSHFELDGIELAIVIDDADAAYPITVDPLITSPSWTGESDQANAEFGASVATAGDVNGDGFSDVIVGAWKFDNGHSDEGRAFLFLGSPEGLSLTPAWTAESDQTNARFGVSVGCAGDVNADGFHDVIVGAEFHTNGQLDEGRAFVFLGSPAGLAATPAWTAEGNEIDAEFGYSVGTAGDVNGDGFSDVIVGARYADNDQANEGGAYVYHGSASGLATSPSWVGEGNQAFSHYGHSVATAGDVNGDGFADVIVGAFAYDNGQPDEGRAFVYHGSATGLATAPAWSAESNQASAWYGWSVSSAGDIDGDGFCDVIVGAPQYTNGQTQEGRAFVYRGSGVGLGPTAAWTFVGGQIGASLGYSVATAGDVNGDGFADVILGANLYDNDVPNEGRAVIYRGSATGLIGVPYWSAYGEQAAASFGLSVGTAGDVNGDGYSDVIVGANLYDNEASNEGRAFVYHGSADELAFPESWAKEGEAELDNFSSSVATAGDVNGDGFSDAIVGAPFGGESRGGRAYLFLGSSTGLGLTPSWIVEGRGGFGDCVGTAGDVNGDGYSDVIVGAHYDDNEQGDEGRAFVYLGSPAGLATSPAWTAESDQNGAEFGTAVGSAGDVNGDGYSDVIVGALYYDNGQTNEGRAYVYLGSPAGLATSAAWIAESDQAETHFGISVGAAGDVNGDGFSDVIVGAPFYSNGQTNEGRAYVYLGSPSGLATSAAWTAESDQVASFFGFSVGTAGDVDGDGFSDVIVGSHFYDNGQSAEGRAFVYLGSSVGLAGSPAWTAESNQVGALFGFCVRTAGDVNSDGFSDVIVAARDYDSQETDEGRAYVYYGSPAGLATLSTWAPTSGQAFAWFGYSLGTAGDANGDGFSDVIVGALYYDDGQTNEGRAFAYYGNLGDGLDRIPQQQRIDNSPIAVLGLTDDPNEFRMRILGRTPAGRGRVRIEGEVQPYGTPFAGGAEIFRGPFVDTGTPGPNGSAVTVANRPGGLHAGTLYCWRVRTATDSPFFPRSPWFKLAANGSVEADLRAKSEGTGVASASPVAGIAWLEPIAPNPFSTVAELAYTLPERGAVRLAVYDVSGREVVVLVNELEDAGRHIAKWDGHDDAKRRMPAGVYFARLESGGRVEARKVVLAR